MGSAAKPRIADGKAGSEQLAKIEGSDGVSLTEALKNAVNDKDVLLGEVLERSGQPPVPPMLVKKAYKLLAFSEHGMYDYRYPVRTFK